ncbi:tail protein [soil metagenome]
MIDVSAEVAKIDERIELATGGRLYAGWTSVSVTRSLDALSGSFSLTLAAKGATADIDVQIRSGDRCEVRIGGATVINGWIDTVAPSIDANDHRITVSGRDRTADLADCSAIHKPGTWRKAKVEAIAAELAAPFGIKVTARVSTGNAIAKFALQQGETVQAAIERLLRFRGLLMVANADGDLEIITPDEGAPAGTLEYGVNILSASATHDVSGRFSSYLIKGQAAGDDTKHGKTVSQISGTATDAGVGRYRPLLVIAEEQGDAASLKVRAAWEAGVRAGKAVSAEIGALGWRVAAGGALWRPNMPVQVKCGAVQLPDEAMLVTAVTLTRDEGGTIATITVMPPGAWKQLAEPEKAK